MLLGPGYELAAFQPVAHGLSRLQLAGMGAHDMHLVHKRLDAAVEGVEAEGADFVGKLYQFFGGKQRMHCVCCHELRAVE